MGDIYPGDIGQLESSVPLPFCADASAKSSIHELVDVEQIVGIEAHSPRADRKGLSEVGRIYAL